MEFGKWIKQLLGHKDRMQASGHENRKQAFLESLKWDPEKTYGLEVFEYSRKHLINVIDEIEFEDFSGRDYEVMNRLCKCFPDCDSDALLWANVAIDLWFCSNFGSPHWQKLIERNHDNLRFALQAACWVACESGANGSAELAAMIEKSDCWSDAERIIMTEENALVRGFGSECVLPLKGNTSRD